MIRLVAFILFPLAFAIVAGTASAWYAIDHFRGFGAVRSGQWLAYPTVGTATADPYAIARASRESLVPLGAAEGLAFYANRDSDGALLDFDCAYRITGHAPAARVWTIYAQTGTGGLAGHKARRVRGLHSRQLFRQADSSFSINTGRYPQSGNWLAIDGSGKFQLVLTAYDSPAANRSTVLRDTLPQIHRLSCV